MCKKIRIRKITNTSGIKNNMKFQLLSFNFKKDIIRLNLTYAVVMLDNLAFIQI